MAIKHLKKAAKTPASGENETREIAADMLTAIETEGEDKAREYGSKLHGWNGDIVVGTNVITMAAEKVPH